MLCQTIELTKDLENVRLNIVRPEPIFHNYLQSN